MVIWGDVAYRKGLFFSPDYWRRYFKPVVKAIVEECHQHGLPVIYHGCGNVRRIFQDFIEIGVDAYNPLEAKAGMDVVALRRQLRPPDRILRQSGCDDLGRCAAGKRSDGWYSRSLTRPRGAGTSSSQITLCPATSPARITITWSGSCVSTGGIRSAGGVRPPRPVTCRSGLTDRTDAVYLGAEAID